MTTTRTISIKWRHEEGRWILSTIPGFGEKGPQVIAKEEEGKWFLLYWEWPEDIEPLIDEEYDTLDEAKAAAENILWPQAKQRKRRRR